MKKRCLALAAAAALILALPAAAAKAPEIEVHWLSEDYTISRDTAVFAEGLTRIHLGRKGERALQGAADKNGSVVVPAEYDYLRGAGDRLLGKKGDECFLLDTQGQILADLSEYQDISYLADDGLLRVTKDGLSGLLDKNGKVLFPCGDYDFFSPLSDGSSLLKVSRSDLWGVVDKAGTVVLPVEYAYIADVCEGRRALRDAEGRHGFADADGDLVIPCQYAAAHDFSQGLSLVQDENRRWGYIDPAGELVIPCQFRDAGDFHDGLAWVEKDHFDFGYINAKGETVIPFQFQEARDFSEGLAPVEVADDDGNPAYGYIDASGELVIPCQFREAWPFSNGLAEASLPNSSGCSGLIDKAGRVVVPSEYASFTFSPGGDIMALRQTYNEPDSYDFFRADGTFLGGPFVPPEGVTRVELCANGVLYLHMGDRDAILTDYAGTTLYPKAGSGTVDVRTVEDEELLFLTVKSDEPDPALHTYTSSTGADGIKVYQMRYFLDANGEEPFSQVDAGQSFLSGVASGSSRSERSTTIFFDPAGRELFRMSGSAALLNDGRLGFVRDSDGRYGIFENPYYKSDYVPGDDLTQPAGPGSSGTAPSGSSAGPGGTSSGSSSASGGESGGFPVLPVAGGAAALVVLIGAAVVLAKKKRG